jgi:hypothetical protein
MSVAQEVATLQTEVAVLKQQLLHANELRKADAERAAELLAVKDRELQSVHRLCSCQEQLVHKLPRFHRTEQCANA